jgi:hypothetical protein
MSEATTKAVSPKKVRWGRIFGSLLFFILLAAGLYGASWLNARRYYLVVDATEVRVGRGRMLPMGFEAFVPTEPSQRRAYRTFPLPGGVELARGETSYFDRVELDQRLFEILVRALETSLAADNARTAELAAGYLEQLRALPGINAEQRERVEGLGQRALLVEARGHAARGQAELEKAVQQFEAAAKGGAEARGDAEARAAHLREVLRRLRGEGSATPGAAQPAQTGTSTGAAAP